ncbi:MAG TPA: MarR family transcriptional regulator [Flavobacterium sp.]|nr:MarR family transcriptional regulator [Flavobacterium sp.]
MKIEDIIKTASPMAMSKKTVLNVMYTQNMISEKFNLILKCHDLSPEQFNVLRILKGQNGNSTNMCVIQERMIARTSNTTRLVDKLLLKGLVTREICPDNRRKMEIAITQKGLDLLSEINPVVDGFENALAQNLTAAELEQLNTLLEKFRTFKTIEHE